MILSKLLENWQTGITSCLNHGMAMYEYWEYHALVLLNYLTTCAELVETNH